MLGLGSMDTNLKGSPYTRVFRWLLRCWRTAEDTSTGVKPDDANFVLLPMRLLLQSQCFLPNSSSRNKGAGVAAFDSRSPVESCRLRRGLKLELLSERPTIAVQ